MFIGFFELGSTFDAPLLIRDTGLSPINADSAPIFRVYGPNGLISSVTGSCTLLDTGTVTAATHASPVVYTSANHRLASGFVISVSGITGNTGANATGIVTVVDANTFSIAGSIGNGTTTSNGTWNMTGLYTYTFSVSSTYGFESGFLYVSVIEGTSGGITFSYTQTWQCN